mmetsp:Transcript_41681/g.67623  ORF Transcript_41681/g.67623 Transcript_41681/m.67623 type:complete len:352 (+) Transcript_41681:1374-2429(+)
MRRFMARKMVCPSSTVGSRSSRMRSRSSKTRWVREACFTPATRTRRWKTCISVLRTYLHSRISGLAGRKAARHRLVNSPSNRSATETRARGTSGSGSASCTHTVFRPSIRCISSELSSMRIRSAAEEDAPDDWDISRRFAGGGEREGSMADKLGRLFDRDPRVRKEGPGGESTDDMSDDCGTEMGEDAICWESMESRENSAAERKGRLEAVAVMEVGGGLLRGTTAGVAEARRAAAATRLRGVVTVEEEPVRWTSLGVRGEVWRVSAAMAEESGRIIESVTEPSNPLASIEADRGNERGSNRGLTPPPPPTADILPLPVFSLCSSLRRMRSSKRVRSLSGILGIKRHISTP